MGYGSEDYCSGHMTARSYLEEKNCIEVGDGTFRKERGKSHGRRS